MKSEFNAEHFLPAAALDISGGCGVSLPFSGFVSWAASIIGIQCGGASVKQAIACELIMLPFIICLAVCLLFGMNATLVG